MKSQAASFTPGAVRRALTHYWAGIALILALSPAGAWAAPMVYLATGNANRILAVDAHRDQVVGEIDGVENAHGLAGAGGMLIAGSLNPLQPGTPIKPAGMSEDEHAAHHSGQGSEVMKAASSRGIVYLIDPVQRRILKKIVVPGFVHHALVTPDGRYGIVTQPTAGGVSVIDMSAGTLLRFIGTGPIPNYAVSSGDSSTVWVSNAGNDTVSEIDTRHWIVRRNVMVGKAPEHMALSPDGSSLYVVNTGDGTVSRVDTVRGETVKSYAVGKDPHGIGISQDGGQLFVSVMGENKLAAIQPGTGAVRTVELGPKPYHLAVVGAHKLYVSSRVGGKIWVVSQRDLKILGQIPVPGVSHQMVVLGE